MLPKKHLDAMLSYPSLLGLILHLVFALIARAAPAASNLSISQTAALNATLRGPSSRPECVDLEDWVTPQFRENDCRLAEEMFRRATVLDKDLQLEFFDASTQPWTGLPALAVPKRWVYGE